MRCTLIPFISFIHKTRFDPSYSELVLRNCLWGGLFGFSAKCNGGMWLTWRCEQKIGFDFDVNYQ